MRFLKFFLVFAFVWPALVAQAQTFSYISGGGNSTSLDVYSFDGAENAPVMVYVHGGAWMIGDKGRVETKPEFFNGLGYVFISVNYTLVPKTTVEGQLEELDTALGFIADHVARVGGDPHNISLIGHSAGAHLVSMMALRPKANASALLQSGALRAVLSIDTRAYDIPRIAAQSGGQLPRAYARPFGQERARWETLSPLYNIGKNGQIYPPFLIAYSGQGNAMARAGFSRDFAQALAQAGGRVSTYDGGQYSHAQINRGIGTSAGITDAIRAFLASTP